MTTRVTSDMFFHSEHRVNVDCRTKVPRELIDDEGRALVQAMRNFEGFTAGDDILVKVLSNDGEHQLCRRTFTVTWTGEILKTGMDARGVDRSVKIIDYRLEPVDDWRMFSAAEVPSMAVEPEILEEYVPDEATLKWNVGKTAYDVIVAGEVWTTVARNEGETKEDFKARALAIAAGSKERAA